MPRPNIADLLAELETVGLVRQLGESEPAYLFKHALTQESAYQSLLNRTRHDIHLSVARTYENLFPERLDEYAAILALHYAEGGDDTRALVYETRAGDVSTRLFANAEAIGHYTRALEIARHHDAMDGEPLKDLYLKRGRVFELSGRYDLALENYGEMQAHARERDDRAMELGALISFATVYALPTLAHDPFQAKNMNDLALALAREIGDKSAESRILRTLMLLSRWAGDPVQAVAYGEESLAIARRFNLREEMAFTLNDLIVHGYANTGQFHQALAVAKEAQQIWREENNLPMLADSYSSMAVVLYPLGKFDEVIEACEQAWKISAEIENCWGQSYSRWMLGDVYSDRGEPELAFKVTQDGITLGESVGFSGAEVGGRNSLAAACAHYGLIERGLDIAVKSATIADQRFSAWKPWSFSVMARLYVRNGKIDDAEMAMQYALKGPIESVIGRLMAIITSQIVLAQAEIAFAKNDLDGSVAVVDKLIDYLHGIDARALLPDALYLKGKVQVAREEIDAALQVLTRAREVAESLSARRTLWQIYAALADIHVRRGNESDARTLRKQAREILNYISAHATDEQRAAFLNLPDVNAILAAKQ